MYNWYCTCAVFRPGVGPEDCNQSHCDQVAESSVLTSVENSDNNVPENVQKYEGPLFMIAFNTV